MLYFTLDLIVLNLKAYFSQMCIRHIFNIFLIDVSLPVRVNFVVVKFKINFLNFCIKF